RRRRTQDKSMPGQTSAARGLGGFGGAKSLVCQNTLRLLLGTAANGCEGGSHSRSRCTIWNYFMKDLLDALQPGDPDLTLANAIDPNRLPAHIAIIMDGNGRWARRRSLPRVAGHQAGVGPVRSTVETCARLGIQVLTLYAFSVENWKRPRAEIETLWRLLRFYLKKELPELQKNGIRLQAIGRLEALPAPVRAELESVVEATSRNRKLLVNLAINYSGRSEILDAVNG